MKRQDKLIHILKKYRFRSFYVQLIIMVLVLATVLSVVSVAILFFQRNTMMEREKELQKINLEYAIEHLDEVISNSYQVIYSVVGNSYVIDGLFDYDRNISSYAESKDIEELISRLYMVNYADESIKNIFIVHTKRDFVIDPDGITDQFVYFKKNFGENVEFWEELAEQRHALDLYMRQESGSLYVMNSVYWKNKQFATLFMELDLNELHEKESFRKFVDNHIVCVTDAEGNIIGYLSEKHNDELIYEAINDKRVEEYLVLSSSTSAKELNVIALAPIQMVTGDVSILFALSLVVYVMAIILGSVVAFFIAGRIYRPLYHAVELIEIAGKREGNDEFEVIEHNVNAIIEDNHAMAAVVTRSTPIVLEAMFRRLIMEVDSDKEFAEMLDMMSIEVRDGYYTAIVIFENSESDTMEKVIDHFFGNDVVSLFKRHREEYVLILYSQYEKSREIILERCKDVLAHTKAIIAVGKMYRNLYSIGKSYHDALKVLDTRKISMKEGVLDANCEYEYIGYELENNTESILHNYIVSGKTVQVAQAISQLFDRNIERDVSFKGYQQLISVFELFLNKAYKNVEASAQERINLVSYEGNNFSVQDLEKRVEIMLENYLRVTEFYGEKSHSDVMDQILKYIEDNIERDIGLDDVAAAVGLTPNYITKYFKNKSGINFKACLTMKRMERAMELLTRTEMTVKDIADRCGYNSSKQFIVNFSKITGVTPIEYRKSHRN